MRAALLAVSASACSGPPDGERLAPTSAASPQQPLVASPASATTVGATAPAPPASSPPHPHRRELAASTERARRDTLERLPALRRSPLVLRTFPPELQRRLETADEVELLSVDWSGDDTELEALRGGTAGDRKDVLGRLVLGPDEHLAVVAWLYDSATRPFGGMKCDQPHHALRFRTGATAIAIAICFECGTLAIRGTHAHRSSVRHDPAFRDFLKARLEAAGIRDLSSDLRP